VNPLGDNLKRRSTGLLSTATLAGILLSAAACAVPQASTEPNARPLSAAATPVNPLPSATATAAAPATETRQSAPIGTFTFPDGHISFDYFAGWTVTVKPGPMNSPEEQKISFEANIKDESGTLLARVYSGNYGDGAAGPAKRTVLDHSPVSGILDASGEATEFGFAYDEDLEGGLHYFMDVREAHEFLAPDGSSGSNQIALADRILKAYVVLGDPTKSPEFATPAAAKAWMETGRYAQLKAMLLSLKYA
jgi:hypothetical protein